MRPPGKAVALSKCVARSSPWETTPFEQVARLLTDTSVPGFYPTLFVLVTEVMDTVGRLVRCTTPVVDSLKGCFRHRPPCVRWRCG